MKISLHIFKFLGLLILSSCNSGQEELKEALQRSSLIVEEAIQYQQARLAALNSENPKKIERFYEFSKFIEKKRDKIITALKICDNSTEMLLLYEDFLSEIRNYPDRELTDQIQTDVLLFKLTPLNDFEKTRQIVKSEVNNIVFHLSNELTYMFSGPSFIFWYNGFSAYHKGDSTYVELNRHSPLILKENLKDLKVLRNQSDFYADFNYRPIQEAKSVFVFKRLPPGEYELNAKAYFQQDDGWLDSKPVHCRFTIND